MALQVDYHCIHLSADKLTIQLHESARMLQIFPFKLEKFTHNVLDTFIPTYKCLCVHKCANAHVRIYTHMLQQYETTSEERPELNNQITNETIYSQNILGVQMRS